MNTKLPWATSGGCFSLSLSFFKLLLLIGGERCKGLLLYFVCTRSTTIGIHILLGLDFTKLSSLCGSIKIGIAPPPPLPFFKCTFYPWSFEQQWSCSNLKSEMIEIISFFFWIRMELISLVPFRTKLIFFFLKTVKLNGIDWFKNFQVLGWLNYIWEVSIGMGTMVCFGHCIWENFTRHFNSLFEWMYSWRKIKKRDILAALCIK